MICYTCGYRFIPNDTCTSIDGRVYCLTCAELKRRGTPDASLQAAAHEHAVMTKHCINGMDFVQRLIAAGVVVPPNTSRVVIDATIGENVTMTFTTLVYEALADTVIDAAKRK